MAVGQDAPGRRISPTIEFNTALKQTALGQGITKVPKTSDPKYTTSQGQRDGEPDPERWVDQGEAADRGITATDTDIQN